MAKISVKLDINRLVEYFGGLIKSGIGFAGKKLAEKEQLRKTANAVFKAAAKEMYQNMAILGEQDYTDLKKCAINSPRMSLRGAELRGILSAALVQTEARSQGNLLYRLV
jgi:hypothetical protein